ncbi:MAG: SpoIIE family protein phosphatase [Gemmatimonadales bacterium]
MLAWPPHASGWTLPIPPVDGPITTPEGSAWLEPVPDAGGIWLEFSGVPDPEARVRHLLPVVGMLFQAERHAVQVSEELASRYEEIDLLYAISEILGRTVHLEEAAQTIVREVSTVVGARRASIMVFDDALGALRTVASRGFSHDQLGPVPADSRESIAAQVYREKRVIAYDPDHPVQPLPVRARDRGYRGQAFVSVPICYAAPGTVSRCIGVVNLTDRLGADAFSPRDVKLLTAIANQIGAAIENSRLVHRDLQQKRLERELELAHQLQLRLLPSPSVLQGAAEVAARFLPAESVGGDFYTFTRLPGDRVGVMLGDVSSHGFSAALVMALVMSAAGIHSGSSFSPDETLGMLLESLEDDLASTDMYLSVFYGVISPREGQLIYANAGHPHAFRMRQDGTSERLETTAPPLGLASIGSIKRRTVEWKSGEDLLCLWTDGLVEARSPGGAPFGDARLLQAITSRLSLSVDQIVDGVFAEAEAFAPEPADDRTVLVMKA